MSRIRQIKPSWFLDKELRRGTTAEAREFYVGLWMLADDAGWLVWDVERITAELFPYDPVARREHNAERWAATLERLNPQEPHLVVYSCGHARVPKMPGHQRIAGTRVETTKRAHLECRNSRSRLEPQMATSTMEPQVATRSHGIGRVGNGTVGRVVARDPASGGPRGGDPATAGEALSDFARRVPRAAALKGTES